MALSLASAQRCLALDSRVSGCESRILAVGESVGGVSERLEHIRLLVEAQSRAHRRLVGTVSALQSVVGSMDDRLRRVENASALRDALVDVACALAAWRVSGALAWTARRSLPAHAAGALVLGRRVVAVIELVSDEAASLDDGGAWGSTVGPRRHVPQALVPFAAWLPCSCCRGRCSGSSCREAEALAGAASCSHRRV